MLNSLSQRPIYAAVSSAVNKYESKNDDVKRGVQFPTSIPDNLTAFFSFVLHDSGIFWVRDFSTLGRTE